MRATVWFLLGMSQVTMREDPARWRRANRADEGHTGFYTLDGTRTAAKSDLAQAHANDDPRASRSCASRRAARSKSPFDVRAPSGYFVSDIQARSPLTSSSCSERKT